MTTGGFSLVVLAAGMGSRYGGLKQLDPVGPNGEVVLDYSVRDALAAGFRRVVFVIRRDFEDEFRNAVLSRYPHPSQFDVVFQELTDLPEGFTPPPERVKPWGTAHAILAARHVVKGPFGVVNADDFYGADAFRVLHAFLAGSENRNPANIALVAYHLENTLSEHGTVSRGVCSVHDGRLSSIEEFSQIRRGEDGLIRGVSPTGNEMVLNGQTPVSMNLWGFPAGFFDLLQTLFLNFLAGGGIGDPKAEFYIPSAVNILIEKGKTTVNVLSTTARWLGVTYREDRAAVAAALSQLAASRAEAGNFSRFGSSRK